MPGARPPRDLQRQVMQRALWLGAAVLVLAAVLGLGRASAEIEEEVDAAMALAQLMAGLGQAAGQDDEKALAGLRTRLAAADLRHLQLRVTDAQGRELLASAPDAAPSGLARLPGLRWLWRSDARHAAWSVPRPAGGAWQVELRPSRASEGHEALANLAGTLALLLLCIAALLAAMQRNIAHALRPLDELLAAISGIGRDDLAALHALRTMPVRELEQLAAALRHLALQLQQAQHERRELAQKVLTLQEDERQHLARELHDELGQRLTALRVDAAWLLRRVQSDAALAAVVQGMAEHAQAMQQEVRALLERLQPFAGSADEGTDQDTLGRLVLRLQPLATAWQQAGGGALQVDVALQAQDAQGRPCDWPAQAALPRVLAQALFRMSQEALTNVARHAQARSARLALDVQLDGAGRPLRLRWSVSDDGVGLGESTDGAATRGHGLAGMRERAWACGGNLQVEAVAPTGTRVAAEFEWPAVPLAQAA